MISVSGIDWSKVTKAGEIAPPKFAPKGVTTFMQPPKQSVNLKKFIPQVAPKEEYISPYMELNKPISPEQKQVVMALGANIKKGDDLATIRQKFPEIADIGDKSLQALRANIMKGDSPEMIEKKFPELQWIKTKQTDDKYKYNIMNKPTQFLQGLREKAENIDIPVVEPLAKGVLGTAMLGTKGMRDVIQGGAGLLDKGIAGATGTDKVYKSGVAEDVFDVAQGSSNTLASVVAPVSVTALGTVMSALPKPVQQSVGDIFQNIGGFIAKTPGLKQWKESLPPERRAEFDNEVMGGLTALFFGAKNKLNLLKNPKAFVQENILNPQNVFKNIEKNVFNIPGRIKNIPTDITNKSKDLGETVLSSSRKIQPAIKSKFNETFGDKIEGFALKNGLVGSDVSDSAKLANNFKIEKMANKIDEVAKFGWTKNDDIYKLISRETIDMFEKNFSKAIKKNIDDFTSKDWELVKRTDKSGFDMYEQLKKFQNSDDITYLQLEALKEVFDYYNPAKLEYDYKGRPVNVGEKDFWFGARNKLQDDIETAGEKNGVDIKGINKDIQKAHILYRGLTRAEARMDNHNILGLMDTQIATFGTLVGGGAAGIGGLLVRKALQSDSFLSGLSKTLYGSKSRTPYNLSNTSSTSRVGRISNSLRSTYNSALAIPKGQKLNSPIPGPAPIRPDVVTPTGKVIPSKFKRVIEMGEATQPGTTKLDTKTAVKLEGQENMPKTLPNTNLPKKMPTEGIQTAEVPKMLNKGLPVKEIMGRIKAKKLPDGKYKLVYIGTNNAVEIGGKPITELFDNPKQARGYYEAMWYKNQQPKSPKPQEKQAVIDGEKGNIEYKNNIIEEKNGVVGVYTKKGGYKGTFKSIEDAKAFLDNPPSILDPLKKLARESKDISEFTEKATKLVGENKMIDNEVERLALLKQKTNKDYDYVQALSDIYHKEKKVGLPIKETPVPKQVPEAKNIEEDLLAEARKYKSAEEFVNKQGTKVYHFTDSNFDELDMSKSKFGDVGKGFYTTDNIKNNEWGKNMKTFIIKKDAKVRDVNNISDAQVKEYFDAESKKLGKVVKPNKKMLQDYPTVIVQGIDNGMIKGDVVVVNSKSGGKNYIIKNKTAIKTDSELKKIREQANKNRIIK